MLGTLGKRLFGTANDRYTRRLAKIVEEVNALEPELEALRDSELADRTPWFRERLEGGLANIDILVRTSGQQFVDRF